MDAAVQLAALVVMLPTSGHRTVASLPSYAVRLRAESYPNVSMTKTKLMKNRPACSTLRRQGACPPAASLGRRRAAREDSRRGKRTGAVRNTLPRTSPKAAKPMSWKPAMV